MCAPRARTPVIAATLALSALAPSASASAGPLGVSVSAQGLYGAGVNATEGAPTAYGLGVGGRVGYTWSSIYLGGVFDFYAGSTEPLMRGEVSAESIHAGAEVGYVFDLLPIVALRPYLGLGFISQSFDTSAPLPFRAPPSESFILSPGLAVTVSLAPIVFAIADVRLHFPTERIDSNEKAFSAGLGVGLAF